MPAGVRARRVSFMNIMADLWRHALPLAGSPTHAAPVIGNLEQDRKRSMAANAAQATLIATFVLLCYLLIHFGRWGFYAFPIFYAALLVFYDARPDLAQRIFPKLWRETK